MPNADRFGSDYTYQGVVTYMCLGGFTVHGSSTITCGLDGRWTNPPTCTGKSGRNGSFSRRHNLASISRSLIIINYSIISHISKVYAEFDLFFFYFSSDFI